MNKSRILLTGASGFVGKHLLKKLISCNYEILAISRNGSRELNGVNWLLSDLSNPKQYRNEIIEFSPEIVIHLAWEDIPDFSFDVSYKNLKNSLEFFSFISKIGSIKKIIAAGSCWEYGKDYGSCSESDFCYPKNNFTWAKKSLLDWLQSNQNINTYEYIWLRIFYAYGPGQRNNSIIPTILKSIDLKTLPDIKTPKNSHDYVFIDDVINAFLKSIQGNVKSGVYNIGSGESTSVLEVFRLAEEIITGSYSNSILTEEEAKTRKCEVNFWANLSKTEQSLKWSPNTNLKDGIIKFWNFLKEQNH